MAILTMGGYGLTMGGSALASSASSPTPPEPPTPPTPPLYLSGGLLTWYRQPPTYSTVSFQISGLKFNPSGSGQVITNVTAGDYVYKNGTATRTSYLSASQLSSLTRGGVLYIPIYGESINYVHLRVDISGRPSSLSFGVPSGYDSRDTNWYLMMSKVSGGHNYVYIKSAEDPQMPGAPYTQHATGRSAITFGMRVPPWQAI